MYQPLLDRRPAIMMIKATTFYKAAYLKYLLNRLSGVNAGQFTQIKCLAKLSPTSRHTKIGKTTVRLHKQSLEYGLFPLKPFE